jgi:N4-gp56 family major capsid protein
MRLLTRAIANFPHALVAQLGTTPKVTIPDSKGDTIQWRKFYALSAATTPITEGETPTATEVSMTSDTGTVSEYGAWLAYTDMLEKKAIDPIMVNYSELLGEQAGLTIDTLTRDVAVATTNIVRPTGVGSRVLTTSADVLNSVVVYKAIRALMNANARPIVGTRYIGIMHPYAYFDFRQDSSVVSALLDVWGEGKSNPLFSGYIGTWSNVDWYVSTNAKVYEDEGASSADVYATMIFGRDALGIGGLGAMMPGRVQGTQFEPNTGKRISPVKMLHVPAERLEKGDPLGQRGTLGWRTTFLAKLLNSDFMVKIEHGATA